MPECELCGNEVRRVTECKECGYLFCDDCGDPKAKLCAYCQEEDWEEEEEEEEEWEEEEEEWG